MPGLPLSLTSSPTGEPSAALISLSGGIKPADSGAASVDMLIAACGHAHTLSHELE